MTKTTILSRVVTTKIVVVEPKVIELCAVKAAFATDLTFEEIEALVNWCNCQQSDLWDGMSLQEILNVYRATAEWYTFEAWAEEDWEAAYAAWNAAVIDDGNKLMPRVTEDKRKLDHHIEFPNGKGYTPCTKEYYDLYTEKMAIYDPANGNYDDLSPEDAQRWSEMDNKIMGMTVDGHVGKSVTYY